MLCFFADEEGSCNVEASCAEKDDIGGCEEVVGDLCAEVWLVLGVDLSFEVVGVYYLEEEDVPGDHPQRKEKNGCS